MIRLTDHAHAAYPPPMLGAGGEGETARGRRGEGLFSAALLAVVGVVVPVTITWSYGALNIPRSDDWSYLRTLFTFSRTGHWHFNDWASMTLFGHVLLATPVVKVFGDSPAAVNGFVACIGLAGLLGLVKLGRLLGVAPGGALLVAVSIAVGPMWGTLAPTFMTDVPAFAVQTLALVAVGMALRTQRMSLPWFAASLALAALGVAIRQYGAITLVAVVIAGAVALRSDRRSQRIAAGLVGATVMVLAAVAVAWSSVPDRLTLTPSLSLSTKTVEDVVGSAGGFLRLAGLLLLPVIVYANPRRVMRRAVAADRDLSVVLGGTTALVLLLAYVVHGSRPFVGNYVDRRGALSDDILHGQRPLVLPSAVFDALVLIASLAAIALVLSSVPWIRSQLDRRRAGTLSPGDPLLLAAAVTLITGFVAYELAVLVQLPMFDRYALPLVGICGLLHLRAARPSTDAERSDSPLWVWVGAALLVTAGLGLAFTSESSSYDSARWAVAQRVVQRGFAPGDVDAGYEWSGWMRGVAPPYGPADRTRRVILDKKRRYLVGTCVEVVVNPPHRPRVVIAEGRTSAWSRASVRIYAVPTHRPCGSGHPSP